MNENVGSCGMGSPSRKMTYKSAPIHVTQRFLPDHRLPEITRMCVSLSGCPIQIEMCCIQCDGDTARSTINKRI